MEGKVLKLIPKKKCISTLAASILLLILTPIFVQEIGGQVCSSLGQICIKTTDCCKGCCEAHLCVERPYSCSTDMVANPGGNTCIKYYCPPGQICFLAELCDTERPCPLQPRCRAVRGPGYTYDNRNRNETEDLDEGNAGSPNAWNFVNLSLLITLPLIMVPVLGL